jgi:aryl carrier-like protein
MSGRLRARVYRATARVVAFNENANGGLNVANDLTELTPHINEMRTKLSQTADHERSLTQSLSNELNRMDQQTLHSVRNMRAEHEARRAGIMIELQALAASMCTFQPPHEAALPQRMPTPAPVAAPIQSDWPPQRAIAPEPMATPAHIAQPANERASDAGNWRQAITNLDIRDDLAELELYMTGRDPRH